MKASAILLSGGKGIRMSLDTPKQYLSLEGLPIAFHSFSKILASPLVRDVTVVCESNWQPLFLEFALKHSDKKIEFASPGIRRQDSLYSGLSSLKDPCELILIHDAARPFITLQDIEKIVAAGHQFGAAALSIPVTSTMREVDTHYFAIKTPKREDLREILTPQVVKLSLLKKGFDYSIKNHITVTDDVALAEIIGHSVKMIEGEKQNIKITTLLDLEFAEFLLKKL